MSGNAKTGARGVGEDSPSRREAEADALRPFYDGVLGEDTQPPRETMTRGDCEACGEWWQSCIAMSAKFSLMCCKNCKHDMTLRPMTAREKVLKGFPL